ncbi:MAG: SH3 domain-containing protein [Novosphingobium sp.]|uniref:SH3 domain-containing protein n=1 Tax=Novosphingobium sp. TaxID=1874826 RepID=UPI0030180115
MSNAQNDQTTGLKDGGDTALRHLQARALREVTPSPLPMSPTAKTPKPPPAEASGQAAKPVGTKPSPKPAKGKGCLIALLIVLVAVSWFYLAETKSGLAIRPLIAQWVAEVFAGPDERAWLRARKGGFFAIEEWLGNNSQSEFADEARAELARLADMLATVPETQTRWTTTTVNLRTAPSIEAAIVGQLPRNAAIEPIASVRDGDWIAFLWQGVKVYAASSLFVARRAGRRRYNRSSGRDPLLLAPELRMELATYAAATVDTQQKVIDLPLANN